MKLPHQLRNLGTKEANVQVTPLVAGTFTLPERSFVAPVDPEAKRLVPSLSFLITHHNQDGSSTRMLFDLGVRGKAEAYTPEIQTHLKTRQPAKHNSAASILSRNGISPSDIKAVILSHVHWDHHGDPSDFPGADFFVGNGSRRVLEHGLPGRGTHSHFDSELLHDVKSVELSDPVLGSNAAWPDDINVPGKKSTSADLSSTIFVSDSRLQWEDFDVFGISLDLFGDGTVFLIPAPGHLPGHVNLLCRTSEMRWLYLAGDAFHDDRLLSGEKDIAEWENNGHRFCIHYNKAKAEETIGYIRELKQLCDQEAVPLDVIAAHDCAWLDANRERCLE